MNVFVCDECGRQGRREPGTNWCTGCEAEYRQGMADVDLLHAEQAVYGKEVAEALEMEREIARG